MWLHEYRVCDKGVSCVPRRPFSGPRCLTPPFLRHRRRCTLFSPPHLRGNRCCMLLCCCLSTAKVSPMCLMDLPVRFSVRFRVPPRRSWAAGPCHCLSPGVSERRRGGDEIGLIMAALFPFCSVCGACARVGRETPGQTEAHKGRGPFSTDCQHAPPCAGRAELPPSQPFTHIKALSHSVGTLTFAFCWTQRIF